MRRIQTAAVDEAARLLGFDGDVVERASFAGREFSAVVQPDLAEIQRRDARGLGAILDRDLLAALHTLPQDDPLPTSRIDPCLQAFLDNAPEGVVAWDTGVVRRLWRPALSVKGILVQDSDWRAGLDRVSFFSPDAARGLILTSRPDESSDLLRHAFRLGVGVVLALPDTRELALKASSQKPVEESPRHWRFLETVYRAWTRQRTYARSAQALR